MSSCSCWPSPGSISPKPLWLSSRPFALGLVLALLLDPLVNLLLKRGLGRMPATGLVFTLFLLLIFGVGWMTIPALIAQATDLAQNGPGYITSIQTFADHFLKAHPKIGPVKLPGTFDQLTQQFSGRASALVQDASGHIVSFLLGSANVMIQLILTLIIAFYFLVDIDRLRARLFYLAPEKWRGMMGHIGSDVGGVFSDYLRGLLIVCALYGVATIGMLYVLSYWHHSLANYALLVGAAAGVLYAVPYLGAFSIALVTFLVAFAAASADGANGVAFGGIALAATLGVNQVFDNVVTPRVVGGGVGLHPILGLVRPRHWRRDVRHLGNAAVRADCRQHPGHSISDVPAINDPDRRALSPCSGRGDGRKRVGQSAARERIGDSPSGNGTRKKHNRKKRAVITAVTQGYKSSHLALRKPQAVLSAEQLHPTNLLLGKEKVAACCRMRFDWGEVRPQHTLRNSSD